MITFIQNTPSTEVTNEDVGIIFLVFILIGAIFYFIPLIIAIIRKKSNLVAIGALNLLLGWTFIGWVVSLIWSLSKDNKPQTIIINQDKSISKKD